MILEDFIMKNLPTLNFVEIVCLYLLFDVKKSLNKLSAAIEKLSDKVDKIERLEQKVEGLETELKKLL